MNRKSLTSKILYFIGLLLIISIAKVLMKNVFRNQSSETKTSTYVFKPKVVTTSIGSLYIPEGGSLTNQNSEIPTNFKDAYSSIRYFSCVHTESEITIFAYDFQSFKKASLVMELKGGVEGMINKLTENLGVREISSNWNGNGIKGTYDGLFVGKADTTRLLCKAAMGGTTVAVYVIIAPTRKQLWQTTLFDKSSLMVLIDPIKPIQLSKVK